LLTWVHRLTKIRRREQDLFGHWGSAWQVIRTSNGYSFVDPLEAEPGRRVWCKSENRTRPAEPSLKKDGAPPDAAQIIQEETSRPPPEQTEGPKVALRREQDHPCERLLSPSERAALVERLDTRPTRADWLAWERDLAARIRLTGGSIDPTLSQPSPALHRS
jgi:hypothetical protein